MFEVLIFGASYAVKGGWMDKWDYWRELSDRFPFLNKLDGKVFAFLIMLVGLLFLMDFHTALVISGAWMLGISPSMGEEAGGTGRWGRVWGDYIDAGFDQKYAIKKALIRGVFTTALIASITGNPWLILAGASFPLVYWIMQTVYFKIHGKDSWAYAEPAYGALIGLSIAMGG